MSIVERDEDTARQLEEALSQILPDRRVEVDAPPPGESRPELGQRGPVPEPGEAYDVFISYKFEDADPAHQVYEFLTTQGLRTFFSRETLPRLGTDEYHERIDSAIEKTRHMVVVTTSGQHAEARWARYEWRLFLGEKLAGRKTGNLVTVIAGGMGIDELPIGLRHREVIPLTPRDLGRLLEYFKTTA